TDDAARLGLPEERVGPPQLPAQRVAIREQPLRDALADNHDGLAVAAIVGREVAAGDDRDANHREESRRDDPEPSVWGLLTACRRVTLGVELEPGRQRAGVAPRHEAAERNAFDARQR